MKHLFVLVPDLKVAKNMALQLQKVGVKENDIHIMGKEAEKLNSAHLHKANILQTSDFIPAFKRGAFIGLFLSALLYIIFYTAVPHINLLSQVAILLFGISFGAWASTLIGIGINNPIVEKYKKYISEGYYLLLVDVPPLKKNELTNLITRYYPDAQLVGITS